MVNEFTERQTLQLNPSSKRKLMAQIGQLPDGLYDVQIKRRQRGRSLDANAYYFAAIVSPFQQWLSEQWGEQVRKEDAHKALAKHILGSHSLDCGIEIPLSTSGLSVSEFSEYIEKCSKFLAEFAEITVVPSDLYWEAKAAA